MPTDPPVIAVVGPTACGKSAVAFALAERLGGEIVSVDSVQVYRGMDVGSAKAPRAWRDAIPHHMIDVLDPWEEGSAGWYREQARRAIEDIKARGKPVILAGGSPLYYFALTTDLPLHPPSPALRKELEERASSEGLAGLLAELQTEAPGVSEAIDTANIRRVIRALEIAKTLRSQGKNGDGWYAGVDYYCRKGFPVVGIGVSAPRPALQRRIAERAASMIEGRLVEEVAAIFGDPPPAALPPAALAIGYRQVLDCRAAGLGREEMIESISSATWKLARRQKSWFRRDPRLCWFSSEEPAELLEGIAVFVERRLEGGRQHSFGDDRTFELAVVARPA